MVPSPQPATTTAPPLATLTVQAALGTGTLQTCFPLRSKRRRYHFVPSTTDCPFGAIAIERDVSNCFNGSRRPLSIGAEVLSQSRTSRPGADRIGLTKERVLRTRIAASLLRRERSASEKVAGLAPPAMYPKLTVPPSAESQRSTCRKSAMLGLTN